MVTKKSHIILLLSIILLGNECSFMHVQREHDKKHLVESLENTIPEINTDSLFSCDYDGIEWINDSRDLVYAENFSLKKYRHLLFVVIQKVDTSSHPVGLAWIDYNYYFDEIIDFRPSPLFKDSSITIVDDHIKKLIIRSKDVCNSTILNRIPHTYFGGANWRKGARFWQNSNGICYYSNFYLFLYYKGHRFQLIYVDDENKKKLLDDDEFTHIYNNWFIHPYALICG